MFTTNVVLSAERVTVPGTGTPFTKTCAWFSEPAPVIRTMYRILTDVTLGSVAAVDEGLGATAGAAGCAVAAEAGEAGEDAAVDAREGAPA